MALMNSHDFFKMEPDILSGTQDSCKSNGDPMLQDTEVCCEKNSYIPSTTFLTLSSWHRSHSGEGYRYLVQTIEYVCFDFPPNNLVVVFLTDFCRSTTKKLLMTEDQDDNEKPKKPTTHDERGAADLERVTDYFEEKELSVGLDAVKAVSDTAGDAVAADKAQKQKQMLKIKVKNEDVSLIVGRIYFYVSALYLCLICKCLLQNS